MRDKRYILLGYIFYFYGIREKYSIKGLYRIRKGRG
jgi:hypothetical protein